MKKAELVYLIGCPSVPRARQALRDSRVEFEEVVQDELAEDDPRRKYCSPSLLLAGEVVVGSRVEEASCSLDRWNSPEIAQRLAGLASGDRSIGCCIRIGESSSVGLAKRHRLTRFIAGAAFLVLAIVFHGSWSLALLFGWFGLSHVVAGVTGYPGCPELGAIPSALLGRGVATRCGPWEWLDRRM